MALLLILSLATSGVAGAGLLVVDKPKDVAALVGSDVTLLCKASQLGDDHLVWQRSRNNITGELIFNTSQGQILHSDANKFHIQGQYNLVIKNIQYEDAGIYGCGTASQAQFYTAFVVVIANFTCHDEEIKTVEGETVSLACSVDYGGFKAPYLRWMDGQRPLGAGVQARTDGYETEHFVHNITSVATSNNDGKQFHCELYFQPTPPIFSQRCATRLVVLYKVRAVSIVPSEDALIVGDNLTCLAQGNPKPKYDWFDVTSGKVIGHEQVITITDDMAGHNFTYSCNASNAVIGQLHAVVAVKSFSVTVKDEKTPTAQRSTTVAWTVGGVLIVLILLVALFAVFTRLGKRKGDQGVKLSDLCKCLPLRKKSDKSESVHDNPLFDVITGEQT